MYKKIKVAKFQWITLSINSLFHKTETEDFSYKVLFCNITRKTKS